jgi:hypothetical protein
MTMADNTDLLQGKTSPHHRNSVTTAEFGQVTDLNVATKELLALGAAKPEFQPGEGQWTVLTDPEGHLFCIAAG